MIADETNEPAAPKRSADVDRIEIALLERLAARAQRNAEGRTGPDADWWERTATWLMGHAATTREVAARASRWGPRRGPRDGVARMSANETREAAAVTHSAEREQMCGAIGFDNPACDATGSAGARCENTEPHEVEHYVGSHTIEHALAGNGYACSAMSSFPGRTPSDVAR